MNTPTAGKPSPPWHFIAVSLGCTFPGSFPDWARQLTEQRAGKFLDVSAMEQEQTLPTSHQQMVTGPRLSQESPDPHPLPCLPQDSLGNRKEREGRGHTLGQHIPNLNPNPPSPISALCWQGDPSSDDCSFKHEQNWVLNTKHETILMTRLWNLESGPDVKGPISNGEMGSWRNTVKSSDWKREIEPFPVYTLNGFKHFSKYK